jgi:DNA gyrase/topoisomerase IV subunit B
VSYTAADITELDDVQHTRLRPAVNLGLDVLNTALRELVDNAIEEVADPSHGGSAVTITLHVDGSVSVADDGRGLPVDSDPVSGKNGIVKTLGTARAGGKFSAHTDAASTGAGLNGIGAAAAVFISARADVTVRRAGKTYLQSFGGGYPGVFDGKDFDPDALFNRADTQKLRGTGNRKPDAHGTTVRILLCRTQPSTSTKCCYEHMPRRGCRQACTSASSTKAGPATSSGPSCSSRSAARGAPTRCSTSCATPPTRRLPVCGPPWRVAGSTPPAAAPRRSGGR